MEPLRTTAHADGVDERIVRHLKRGPIADTAAATDAVTRAIVEAFLGEVEARGDEAAILIGFLASSSPTDLGFDFGWRF